MAGDERPEVATRVSAIRIPDLSDASPRDAAAKVAAFSEQFPGSAAQLLVIATDLNSKTITLITTVGERLGQRRQDIEDLLSIVKSAQEMTRKIDRLSRRLLAEEGGPDVR